MLAVKRGRESISPAERPVVLTRRHAKSTPDPFGDASRKIRRFSDRVPGGKRSRGSRRWFRARAPPLLARRASDFAKHPPSLARRASVASPSTQSFSRSPIFLVAWSKRAGRITATSLSRPFYEAISSLRSAPPELDESPIRRAIFSHKSLCKSGLWPRSFPAEIAECSVFSRPVDADGYVKPGKKILDCRMGRPNYRKRLAAARRSVRS